MAHAGAWSSSSQGPSPRRLFFSRHPMKTPAPHQEAPQRRRFEHGSPPTPKLRKRSQTTLFFSRDPMKAGSVTAAPNQEAPQRRRFEPDSPPSPKLRQPRQTLIDAARTDEGAKLLLGAMRAKRAKRRRPAKKSVWPKKVLDLVQSVFGIWPTVDSVEKDAVLHTVAQIDEILRSCLRFTRARGRRILRCLVQDYRMRRTATWRPWLLTLIHEGGFGPQGPGLVGGKVAKRYTAYPPEKMKELMQRQDFVTKYSRVLEEFRELPERRMEAVREAKAAWADKLSKDLRQMSLEERDGLDALAEDIQAQLKDTGQKATVANLGQRKYELAHAPKFKEELRKAAKRKTPQADVNENVEIDSDSASESAEDCGRSFAAAVNLVAEPQLQLIFRVTENLKEGALGHYRLGLNFDTRFDQAVLRICRARHWMVRDVLLMAERPKGDFVVQLSDTPALRSIRRNSVIDMYYTTPPWRKNFTGRARQPVTTALRDELQAYWFRTRGTEDLTIQRQKGVIADEDCLCAAASTPKPRKRLRAYPQSPD